MRTITCALLAVLNSSTACFWLKQVSQIEGTGVKVVGIQRVRPGNAFYEFTGTSWENFRFRLSCHWSSGGSWMSLAQELAAVEPSAVCAEGVPTRERLDAARAEHERIRGRMIALQEELDWDVYRRYGLLDEVEAAELIAKPDSVPELRLGERAFEIVLARRVKAGEAETQWFARHGSTPITEIPANWPQEYRDVVAKRIETIERRRDIGLIERPECKRRWQTRAVGEEGTRGAPGLAAGPVRGPRSLVRDRSSGKSAAAVDDGEPAGRPAAR